MGVANAGDVEAVLEAGLVFDVPAALRLTAHISRLTPGCAVVIDFLRTRECHDFALAALSQALVRLGGAGTHVRLRGLTRHHARVLRYMGEPVDLLA